MYLILKIIKLLEKKNPLKILKIEVTWYFKGVCDCKNLPINNNYRDFENKTTYFSHYNISIFKSL